MSSNASENRSLSLAYSPCPNDTYIFAAWTKGLLAGVPAVEVVLDDVEALNLAARRGAHALTKVSYGALPALLENYRVLRSGGALGRGCGPLVVTRTSTNANSRSLAALLPNARIAIPGSMTTAHLLLRLAHERGFEPVVMRFDQIVDAVAQGRVDAGVIIHESRFTYQDAGLTCLLDLGAWWERETGCPIPLGAILIHRDLPADIGPQVARTIRLSLQFARENFELIAPYVREHAFEMDPSVMHAHINLYVNDYTVDLGTDGIAAIDMLFTRAAERGLVPPHLRPEFVT